MTKAERKERFIREIGQHVMRFRAERDNATMLSRKEIGALADERPKLLNKALLANTVRYYRQNPNAAAALGVTTVVTLHADNVEGACTLSADTIAKLLARHPRTIHEALAQATEQGLIETEERPGLTAKRSPIVSRALANDPSASITWIVDAIAGPRPQAGRPRKTPAPMGQGVYEKPLGPQAKNPCPQGADDFSKRDFSKVREPSPSHTPQAITKDWKPSAETVEWAKKTLVITDAQLEVKAAKFRSHQLGSRRAADWDLEIRDWLAKDFPEKQQQVASAAPGLSLQRTWLEAHRVLGSTGWPPAAGPPPGHPGCRVDPGLLAEYGFAPASATAEGRAA